ncbi:MAG: protein tyrosine phosphatase family protein [Isosphaeraceae bacterium]|nr:protein tyrosine phosphatase family protein [Isosphaeraceae bacterium]
MIERIQISDQLFVGAQPIEEQLRNMAREGIKSVVNLRAAGEEDQPLSLEEEGAKARELGLQYLYIPVSLKDMRPDQVDQFREELKRLPGPVFVHYHKGKRAGAFAMMHAAVEAGRTGEQTLAQAEQMGFECDVPALKEFVRGYVDRQRK